MSMFLYIVCSIIIVLFLYNGMIAFSSYTDSAVYTILRHPVQAPGL